MEIKFNSGNLGAETFCVSMKSGEPEMLGEEFETFGVAAKAFRKLSVTVFGM